MIDCAKIKQTTLLTFLLTDMYMDYTQSPIIRTDAEFKHHIKEFKNHQGSDFQN